MQFFAAIGRNIRNLWYPLTAKNLEFIPDFLTACRLSGGVPIDDAAILPLLFHAFYRCGCAVSGSIL